MMRMLWVMKGMFVPFVAPKSESEQMSMCDKCELQYCTDCIDTHTSNNVTFL